ncbi:hypothetical protein LQZ19_08705 [Treponema primitia]|uniref:hypothetical protein n=1 Tax=Treponema primitia TaxID=88058 RepID=UPI00397F6358
MILEAFAVKNALENLLIDKSQGKYFVVGVRNRKTDAKKVWEVPQVTVYYQSGAFPKDHSSIAGPYQHSATIKIELLLGAVATVDLATLKSPTASPADIAAALANSTNATAEVDAKADELLSLLFDIIMQAGNRTLGLDYNPARWITAMQKYPPQTQGEIVLMPASMTMTYEVPEYTTSEEGVPGEVIDTIAQMTADTTGETMDDAKQGATVLVDPPL